MRHVDEYRDPARIKALIAEISETVSRPWTIMEVCGGQTHTIMKYGLKQILPKEITLLHGPGCPVCVTPPALIDQAIALCQQPNVTVCTFGDMLRVPGTESSLALAKARGGDVRIVYSPLDALALAQAEPKRVIVFFAIGFETTAPTTALTVYQAKQAGLNNFTLLVSHVRVPPALTALLNSSDAEMDAFLGAGHVCTVMGLEEYEPICAHYRIPIIVTGFEPADILEGVLMCVQQLETQRSNLENQYRRAVTWSGNQAARSMITNVFEISDQEWRGIGLIEQSGLRLRPEYAGHDASVRFANTLQDQPTAIASNECISGEVLRGRKKPAECPAFGTRCTPSRPLGAPMVSSEGACAAYHRYAAVPV